TASKQSTSSALLNLMGKRVEVTDGQLPISGGRVPAANYKLPESAQDVVVAIRDAAGKVVRVVDLGAQDAGPHTFTFDGKDGNGATLADGAYTIEMGALAPNAQAPTSVDVQTLATVDGVDLSADPPVLLVGTTRIPFDKVQEIREPGA